MPVDWLLAICCWLTSVWFVDCLLFFVFVAALFFGVVGCWCIVGSGSLGVVGMLFVVCLFVCLLLMVCC